MNTQERQQHLAYLQNPGIGANGSDWRYQLMFDHPSRAYYLLDRLDNTKTIAIHRQGKQLSCGKYASDDIRMLTLMIMLESYDPNILDGITLPPAGYKLADLSDDDLIIFSTIQQKSKLNIIATYLEIAKRVEIIHRPPASISPDATQYRNLSVELDRILENFFGQGPKRDGSAGWSFTKSYVFPDPNMNNNQAVHRSTSSMAPSPEGNPVDGSEERERILAEAMAELDNMVGLEAVKTQVRQLTNLIKVNKRRTELGGQNLMPSLHAALNGNPGTGKTTVAKILAKIFYGLGITQKAEIVQVDRSDLVGQYVGHTAPKTQAIIERARGGVLFIDEAYALDGGSENDFGAEAIATLVNYMEEYRDELIVIFAGYKKELAKMIKKNPGLTSRVTQHIEFPDYSIDELVQIYQVMASAKDLTLDNTVESALRKQLKTLLDESDEHFGNGRDVRNLFEQALVRQADRIANIDDADLQTLNTISGEDIVWNAGARKKSIFGFATESNAG